MKTEAQTAAALQKLLPRLYSRLGDRGRPVVVHSVATTRLLRQLRVLPAHEQRGIAGESQADAAALFALRKAADARINSARNLRLEGPRSVFGATGTVVVLSSGTPGAIPFAQLLSCGFMERAVFVVPSHAQRLLQQEAAAAGVSRDIRFANLRGKGSDRVAEALEWLRIELHCSLVALEAGPTTTNAFWMNCERDSTFCERWTLAMQLSEFHSMHQNLIRELVKAPLYVPSFLQQVELLEECETNLEQFERLTVKVLATC